MSLSLLEVVASVRARRASLSAETVGYLLLGVADHVIAVPREIGAADVLLGEEGAIRVGVGTIAAPERTERALRELLDALLSVASTATPALLRIGRRQASAGVEALVRELEAALIPVNRAAARRALTRLYRDTQRATQAGPLDVSAAQAWLQRATAPSVPAPTVASEPSPAAVEPVPAPAASCEVPIEVFEASQPSSITATRPPPLIEERPQFETLTRPEPVLVRAAARARVELREQEIDQEPPAQVGTPLLGTFAARSVLPPLVVPGDEVLLLNADEATDRMPEIILDPAVPLVKTAPLVDVVTAPVASDELSADLASVVTDLVTEGDEPASPVVQAVPETAGSPGLEAEPATVDGDFELDDEIVIIVDEDLEAFEPELLSAPIPDQEPAQAAADPEMDSAASEPCQGDSAYPVTRWWSSPDPPALGDAEPEAHLEHEAPPAIVETVASVELPSVPELELPPLPEFVAWPTPQPPVQVAPTAEPPSAATEGEPNRDADFERWGFEAGDEAYFDRWESGSDDEAYFEAWESEPSDETASESPGSEANAEADFEAAAAGYAALEPESFGDPEPEKPVAEPVLVERRVLSLPEATDFSEVGWTPAPAPPQPPEVSLAPEPQAIELEPPPEPEPEPEPEAASPRFAPRRSDVSELLRGFAVTEARSDRELCRDLKALAGVDLTPPPPRSGVPR